MTISKHYNWIPLILWLILLICGFMMFFNNIRLIIREEQFKLYAQFGMLMITLSGGFIIYYFTILGKR